MKPKSRRTADAASTDEIFVQKWKDNKEVILVSNFGASSMGNVKRYHRRYLTTSKLSNIHKRMGYVDMMDKRISAYRIRIHQRKW